MSGHLRASHRPCPVCGTPFSPRLDHVRRGCGKFCSRQCHLTFQRTPKTLDIDVMFLSRIGPLDSNGCTLWNGDVDGNGYGIMRRGFNGDRSIWRMLAHRYAWERANGPISKGMFVCHHCDVRLCVNLQHLFLGKAIDNITDMVVKQRHGHGETHSQAKLSETAVAVIRLHLSDKSTIHALATRYGVTRKTIVNVQTRHTWKHVP